MIEGGQFLCLDFFAEFGPLRGRMRCEVNMERARGWLSDQV